MRLRPDPAFFLHSLRTRRGLYLLGAGASVGEVAFGADIVRNPTIDLLFHANSFPADLPHMPPLSSLSCAYGADVTNYDIFGRTLPLGTVDITPELIRRIQPNALRSRVMYELARPSYRRRVSDNYLPFRFAPPSLFMNYNHDALASDLLADIHLVIPVHGYVAPWMGSPEALEFIRTASLEYDLAIASDKLLLLEPESYSDHDLARRLKPMACFKPEFIAIIGYSFAWTSQRHNDGVSLDFFVDHYRTFNGIVFVVDPQPERLKEVLAERLHAAEVVGLPARWNLLAHVFLKSMTERHYGRTINDQCEELFDAGYGWSAFPLTGI